MKTLLLLFALTLSISLTAQRTSYDVLAEIQNKVNGNVIFVSKKVDRLFIEYNKLCLKEIRYNVEPQKFACAEKTILFCFVCICDNGHIYAATPNICRRTTGGCNMPCPQCCHQSFLYVMDCAGGMCGNQQGVILAKQ